MTGPRVMPGVNFPANEKILLRDTRRHASERDWLEYHTHRSDFSPAGFPDLCLVRGPRLVFAELKGPNEKLAKVSANQKVWLDRLRVVAEFAEVVEVYLWRPKDWDDILRILW